MNTHLTHHHLHWHWLDTFTHKFSEIVHNTKMWQLIAIAVAIAALVSLIILAGAMGTGGETLPYYGYPGYPVVP